eukprot:366435-Chlamydomonas_euryale.AAC.7
MDSPAHAHAHEVWEQRVLPDSSHLGSYPASGIMPQHLWIMPQCTAVLQHRVPAPRSGMRGGSHAHSVSWWQWPCHCRAAAVPAWVAAALARRT